MYPIGHMALGYFAAYITPRTTKYDFNLVVLWIISVSPDFDLLIPFLYHRGPTHSVVAILVFAVPVFLFRREWLPYVAGFASHALIGDLITGVRNVSGSTLFWPFISTKIDIGVYLEMGSSLELGLELALFLIMFLMRTRGRPRTQMEN